VITLRGFHYNISLSLGGGAAAEHGPDVHIKPVQHEAKEDNDGEELRDKAQDIPDIKNDSMQNLEKDLEKEEVILCTPLCCPRCLSSSEKQLVHMIIITVWVLFPDKHRKNVMFLD
jgi:hypothetical protein